jgi:hypothetical protein
MRDGTMKGMSVLDDTSLSAMNPTQIRTFNDLLAIGGERPHAPALLVEDLRAKLETGLAGPMRAWTESSMWLSKGQLFSALQCEGGLLAQREHRTETTTLHPATAAGTVAHRAIQIVHTHPGRHVEEVVRLAVAGSRSDERFEEFWTGADVATQSDVLMQATSRVMGYLDAWPPMHASWSPRFEEPIQAKIGRVTLSGRVDLLLGRPRADGRQTMMVVDWKSGGIRDEEHMDEAAFYALLATLRFGVPPFRSTIYSLASGAWTEPDIDADVLHRAADRVIEGVEAIVAALAATRAPRLTAGRWCSFCPAKDTCPAAAEFAAQQTGL